MQSGTESPIVEVLRTNRMHTMNHKSVCGLVRVVLFTVARNSI